LQFRVAEYRDPGGRTRCWEYVDRSQDAAAAVVAAECVPSGDLILVRQYRAAMQAETIEFAAGLIDPGESPGEAGLRELLEETGLTGTIRAVGPVLCTSPGLTSERAYLIEVEIDESDPRNLAPRPQRAADEWITVWRVPRRQAERALKDIASEGVVVDSRVWSWVRGRIQAATPRKETGE
jgi:8-oxo-dGTP pyrophosphatase MutT (NUDIX family)